MVILDQEDTFLKHHDPLDELKNGFIEGILDHISEHNKENFSFQELL